MRRSSALRKTTNKTVCQSDVPLLPGLAVVVSGFGPPTPHRRDKRSDATRLARLARQRDSCPTHLTPHRCKSMARSMVHTLRVPSDASSDDRSTSLPRPRRTICTHATPQSQRQHWLT